MKLTVDKINQSNFISFINRLKVIDTFIYFKVDGNEIKAAAYLPQRDAVKYHTTETTSIFQGLQESKEHSGKELKIAFFDAGKLIDAFKQFEHNDIRGEFEFVENDNDLVATTFRIFNSELEITLSCTEPSLVYKDLTDSQVTSIFNTDGSNFKFEIENTGISKLKSLFSMDSEDVFTIEAKGSVVNLKGKNYNMVASSSFDGDTGSVTVFKKYLNLLDKEDYSMHVLSNRVVISSSESDTLLTIATCQGV